MHLLITQPRVFPPILCLACLKRSKRDDESGEPLFEVYQGQSSLGIILVRTFEQRARARKRENETRSKNNGRQGRTCSFTKSCFFVPMFLLLTKTWPELLLIYPRSDMNEATSKSLLRLSNQRLCFHFLSLVFFVRVFCVTLLQNEGYSKPALFWNAQALVCISLAFLFFFTSRISNFKLGSRGPVLHPPLFD